MDSNEQECNANGKLKSTIIVKEYLPSIGQVSDVGPTCEHGLNQIPNLLTLSAEVFRVRMLARLESEQESAASDQGSMWTCLDQSEIYDLRTQSLKTSLGFEQTDLPPCCVTLTTSGMTRNGKLYTLANSVPHTHGKGCSLWPTPTATDYKGASDGWSKRANGKKRSGYLRGATHPSDGSGSSYPHPSFVEALMGFPVGWTELKHSETQSCPQSQNGLEDKS